MPSRPQAGGLPSGPRSRSQGRRSREDDGYSSSSRQMRPQKSLASLKSETSSRAPPMPTARPAPRAHAPSDSSSYRSSDGDSVFSSASSFMDRIRTGTGYASSRTSIDDDGYESPSKQDPAKPNVASSIGDASNASTVWNSVTSAASSLTVNVSKAWTANIHVMAGEETPPGSESRLTRAMRAYHREKAKTPADLPSFLFDESERRVQPPAREPRRREDRYNPRDGGDDDQDERPRAAPSRGLRDIYRAAAPAAQPERTAERSRRPFGDNNAAPTASKATDRLKAMRDAKRAQPGGYESGPVGRDRFDVDDRRSPASSPAAPPPPRVGLPGRPERRRF